MIQAGEPSRSSIHWSTMIQLREYLTQLLEGSYDLLMSTVRKLLEPGLGISRLGRDDFLRFISLAQLCTSFVRQRRVKFHASLQLNNLQDILLLSWQLESRGLVSEGSWLSRCEIV